MTKYTSKRVGFFGLTLPVSYCLQTLTFSWSNLLILQLRTLSKTKNFTETKYFFLVYIMIQSAITLVTKFPSVLIFVEERIKIFHVNLFSRELQFFAEWIVFLLLITTYHNSLSNSDRRLIVLKNILFFFLTSVKKSRYIRSNDVRKNQWSASNKLGFAKFP